FGQRFTGPIKHSRRRATGLLVEVAFVRNPGTAGIPQAERLGIARDSFNVVTVTLVRKVTADGLETIGIKQGFEFFRSESVRAGEFHIAEPETAHFFQRARNIVAEVRAQTVKLQTDGAFEA